MFLKKVCKIIISLFLAVSFSLGTAYAYTPNLFINSDTYVVIDAKTGQVLIEKNKDKRKYPASITKIMTLALTLEDCDLDEKITVSKEATQIEYNSTNIALIPGEIITLRDAVMGTQLISANDAANVLAEYTAGNIPDFVDMMNAKVEELGLKNTHFMNANGLDQKNHYSSAQDMAEITRYAIQNPLFREVFGSTNYQRKPTNKRTEDELWPFVAQDAMMHPENRNYYYDGILGGKLGYTTWANHTLVALAARGDMELIVVCMDSHGTAAKFNDAAKLLDYCFTHFEPMRMDQYDIAEMEVPVYSETDPSHIARIYTDKPHTFYVPFGTSKSELSIKYDIPSYYKNERRIDPTFSVCTQNGTELYRGKLDYEVIPLDSMTILPPTLRSPRAIYISELMVVAFKCLVVFMAVGFVVWLIFRSCAMLGYAVDKKKTSRRAARETTRMEASMARTQEQYTRMENERAVMLGREHVYTEMQGKKPTKGYDNISKRGRYSKK